MNFKQRVVFCCLVLGMLYSSYMLHLLIDTTCQEDAEKLWCESLCQYIEHLCLQKLSLLGTQIFRRKNLKRNQFFQRTTFQFLMHDSLLPRKRLLEILFFKKKFTFSKSVVLLRFTFTISILENKNEQKIVKIEILRTM